MEKLIDLAHGMADYCEGGTSSDDLRALAADLMYSEVPIPLPGAID